MLEVDRDTALRWADQIHDSNVRFINESHDSSLVDISVMLANQTAYLLRGLREMSDDPVTGAALQESAARGIAHGLVSALTYSDAVPYSPQNKKTLS